MDELKRIPYQPIKDLLPRPATGTSERVIALPQPDRTGGLPLMGALWQRMSTREFDEQPLPLQQLSELLQRQRRASTAPRAAAARPLRRTARR